LASQAIIIHGRELKYEIKNVDIFEVDYYYDNPRVNYIISRYPPEQVTSQLIHDTLATLDSTKELRQDIEKNGGLTDEIIILNGEVIEGNTRLCCYRRIYNDNQDDKWKYIRAKVITEDVTQKEIFSLLSNYHIKGKTRWDAYEKAACISKMVEQGYSIEEVAQEIRSTKPKVEAMLNAYKTMRDKYLVRPEVKNEPKMESREEIRKFSYFDAFYSDKKLVKRLKETPQFENEFVEWVSQGKLPKAESVRELNNILCNKKARNAFLEDDTEGCFIDAMEILNWQRPDKVDGFYKKVNRFRELIREANPTKIRAEILANPNKKTELKRCLKDFERFCKDIDLKQS